MSLLGVLFDLRLIRRSFLGCQSVYQFTFYSSSTTTSTIPNNKKFFITTPIFYVNAAPHIGHLYSAVIADAANRWHRFLCEDTLFSTGTDEHGLKVQQAAVLAKKQPEEYCHDISATFKNLFDHAAISYTHYVRTTEQMHKEVVQRIWKVLVEKGYIYRGEYKGWYCVTDEAFYPDSKVADHRDNSGNSIKVSIETGNVVQSVSEENYLFRLSAFREPLLHWLERAGVITPAKFQNLVKSWIQEGLEDLSVSRPSNRLQWGIPVPRDHTQTIYVWLDALFNYLTVSGYPSPGFVWPPTCHVIGKDILKFHAIYWPAFLLASGLPLPGEILCHSHWLADNVKMSKSKGNVMDPWKAMSDFSVDGFRYFLLREGVPHSDGNYNTEKVVKMLNAELADTLGNLLNRCTSAAVNPAQVFPPLCLEAFTNKCGTEGKSLVERVSHLAETVPDHYSEYNFYKGLDEIMSCLRATNAFVQNQKPWTLTKDTGDAPLLNTIVHIAMESLRVCGLLLQPVTPNLSDQLLMKLGVPDSDRNVNSLSCFHSISDGFSVYDNIPLPSKSLIIYAKVKI